MHANGGQGAQYLQAAEQPLLLAVTPNLTEHGAPVPWDALAAHISQHSGRNIRIVQPATLAEFNSCLASNVYDLALAFPHQVQRADPTESSLALVRLQQKPRGLIAVRSDSRYYQLADLMKASIGFPRAGNFAASELTRLELRPIQHGPSFRFATPTDTYRAVLSGQVAAGAGTPASFNALPDHLRDRLRVVHQTDRYEAAAILALSDLGDHVRYRLANAFNSIRTTAPALYSRSVFFAFTGLEENSRDHTLRFVRSPNSEVSQRSTACPIV